MGKQHVGKVVYFSEKKKYSGTGNIVCINSDKIIVATAAHCVYNFEHQNFFSNISFYTDNVKEKIKVDKVFINKKWVEYGNLNSDYAFLVIFKKNISTKYLTNLDYTSPLFELEKGKFYSIYGIPNTSFFKENIKIYSGNAIQDIYRNSNMQGIQAKVINGMSGGPWLIDINGKKYQNSNSSSTFKEAKGILWGPYWDKECKIIFESSVNENMISNLVVEY